MKIVFAGTPEAAVPTLEALIASQHEVVGVFTQPDRPAGRGRHLAASAVKRCAETASLPVFQPEKMDVNAQSSLNALAPDVMVVVAYGLLLPASVLSIPTFGCINVHFSLLPRWRGAAPIQRAILAGDELTGVSTMQMDKGLDTGPILLQTEYPLDPDENSQMLHDRLAKAGAELLIKTLKDLTQSQLKPTSQDNVLSTHAAKIKKAEGLIDWQRSAIEISNQVRAFNPWPVAFTYYLGQRLRLWSAELTNDVSDLPPGTVVTADHEGIAVACGDGVLLIRTVQLPGGRQMAARDFINAHAVLPGETIFSKEGIE